MHSIIRKDVQCCGPHPELVTEDTKDIWQRQTMYERDEESKVLTMKGLGESGASEASARFLADSLGQYTIVTHQSYRSDQGHPKSLW